MEVMRVDFTAEAPLLRAHIYIDAGDASPVAAQSDTYSGTVTLLADVPVRHPGAERHEVPLRDIEVQVDGEAEVTDEYGEVTSPDVPTEIITGLVGSLVKVGNEKKDPVTEKFLLGPGDIGLWSAPEDPMVDGPLTAYVSVYRAKQYVMGIAPDFAWLGGQINVLTNGMGECNAVSLGDLIVFLPGVPEMCENTASMPSIAYHEFGHSVHGMALIPGVGVQESALTEGIADYLSATMTDDPKMGVGFYLNEEPMRDLDPEGYEWHWPVDRGEPHDEGRIIGGTLWDLRQSLIEKLGEEAGVAKSDELWYESLRGASDIPTMYPEVLLADDDDGNLANGTPNQCEIDVAFHRHGLILAEAFGASVSALEAGPDGIPIELAVDVDAKEECLGISVTGAELEWRIRGSGETHDVAMEASMVGFVGLIPPQEDGIVVEYRVKSETSDGLVFDFPLNEADPWYEVYIGPVQEIYCTGFEGMSEVEGWTPFAEWALGMPMGRGGDPKEAFDGENIAGINLGSGEDDGRYHNSRVSRLESPTFDVSGYETVRLQYWRWLQVEDREFDVAAIKINGNTAWVNATRGVDPEMNDLHHLDQEWVFHDLDITPGIVDNEAKIEFTLTSDWEKTFAGWNIDGLCVVGVEAPAAPVCGDGVVDAGEACDDGNVIGGDGCDPSCALEDETSTGGETSGGETGSTGDDSATTGSMNDGDGGCACDLGSAPNGGGYSGILLVGLLALRRRRFRA
ncbi:MAG TPA: hypothetical protein ENJ18_15385 [Nannocystis exedens]|nr:hypothetical protein [Nannocystis exedens]